MPVDVGPLTRHRLQALLGTLSDAARSRWATLEDGSPATPLPTLLAPSAALLSGLQADPWAALAGPAARPAETVPVDASPTPIPARPGPAARPHAGVVSPGGTAPAADDPAANPALNQLPVWMRAAAMPAAGQRAGRVPPPRPIQAPDGPDLPPEARQSLAARLAGPVATVALPTAWLRELAGQGARPVSAASAEPAGPTPRRPEPAAAGARDLAALAAALDPTRHRRSLSRDDARTGPAADSAGPTPQRRQPAVAPAQSAAPAAPAATSPGLPPPAGRRSALVELLQRWPGASAGDTDAASAAGTAGATDATDAALGQVGAAAHDLLRAAPGQTASPPIGSPSLWPDVRAPAATPTLSLSQRPADEGAGTPTSGDDELRFRRRLERVLLAELRRHGIDPGEGG